MTPLVVIVLATVAGVLAHFPPWAVVALDIVAYAVWAYFHPFRKCPKCRGSGINPGSTGQRWGKCRRCGGSRAVKTLGARYLHRAIRAVVKYRDSTKGS